MLSRREIGALIQQGIREKQTTVTGLERTCHVSRCRLHNFLNLQTNIAIESLDKILSHLGITLVIGKGSNDKMLLEKIKKEANKCI